MNQRISRTLRGLVLVLGETAESEFRFKFAGNKVEISAQQFLFGGEPIMFEATR